MMRTIIATDIHGITDELRSMIEPHVRGAVFLSPWETETCPFPDEQVAVSQFHSQNGLQSYAEKISAIAGLEPAYLIGFSVGASAAWRYSASDDCHLNSAGTLYYGSRIRDDRSLVPRIPLTVVFAETESSFSPARLTRSIDHGKVSALVEPGTSHGFMNPRSANFAAPACLAHLQRLALEVERHRTLHQRPTF